MSDSTLSDSTPSDSTPSDSTPTTDTTSSDREPVDATQTDPTTRQLQQVKRRLVTLEVERSSRRQFDGFVRCYAAIAVAMVILSTFPILEDDVVTTDTGTELHYTFGSIWEMASEGGDGNVAPMGVLLLLVVVALLVVAAFRASPGMVGLASAIAVICTLMTVLLLARPGTGRAEPALTHAGEAWAALLILTAVLCVVHDALLLGHRRQIQPQPMNR